MKKRAFCVLNVMVVAVASILLVGSVAVCFEAAATAGASPPSAGMLGPPEARGQRRIGSVLAGANALSGSGRLSAAAFAALGRPYVSMASPTEAGAKYRSVEVQVVSTGAASSTGTIDLYRGKISSPLAAGGVPDYEVSFIGTLSFTISATTGASTGAVVEPTERIASSYVWTPAFSGSSPKPGIAQYLKDAFGGPGGIVYAPGGTTPGLFMLTDAGNGDLVLFDVGNTAGATVGIIADPGT